MLNKRHDIIDDKDKKKKKKKTPQNKKPQKERCVLIPSAEKEKTKPYRLFAIRLGYSIVLVIKLTNAKRTSTRFEQQQQKQKKNNQQKQPLARCNRIAKAIRQRQRSKVYFVVQSIRKKNQLLN